MVKEAIKWSNGMVMVFGANGEQEESLQGRYDDVKDKVLAASGPDTKFAHGVWREGTHTVSREDW